MPFILVRTHNSSSWNLTCQMWGEELGNVKRFDFYPFEMEPDGVAKGGGLGDDKVLVDRDGEKVAEGSSKMKSKNSGSNEKAVVALKNHSEAERRRRERINGHLDVLRGLVSSNKKMDKATLLAEVINQVKNLQEQARHVSKGLLMPLDADELIVEPLHNESKNGVIIFKASLCCNFRPDLFSDLKHAIGSLKLKTLHSEISTLEGRVKTIFTLASSNAEEAAENLAKAIHQTLTSIIYKPSSLPEYSPRTTLSHKRFITPLEDHSPRSVLSQKRFKYPSFASSSSST